LMLHLARHLARDLARVSVRDLARVSALAWLRDSFGTVAIIVSDPHRRASAVL